jgi:molybdenum cofactor cytidylyltransferase
MGRPKLALPLGNRTVLEWVVTALREGGIEPVVVVVGPHSSELIPAAQGAGARVAVLTADTPDMRATVIEGLNWIEERFHPKDDDTWLLVPGDHPTLELDVVQALIAASDAAPAYSIWVPTFEGSRGHPTLAAWKHVPAIRSLPGEQGINAYFRQQAGATLEVPVDTETVLRDVDLPAEYERLRQQWDR